MYTVLKHLSAANKATARRVRLAAGVEPAWDRAQRTVEAILAALRRSLLMPLAPRCGFHTSGLGRLAGGQRTTL